MSHSYFGRGHLLKALFPALILTFLMMVNACKKVEVPDDEVTDPVFWQSFFFADSAKTLYGGQNNSVYMFTRVNKDSSTVSTLSAESCPAGNCPESLYFYFKQFGASAPDEFQFIGTSTSVQEYQADFSVNGTFNPSDTYKFFLDSMLVYSGNGAEKTFSGTLKIGQTLARLVYTSPQDSFIHISERTVHPDNPDAAFVYPTAAIRTELIPNGFRLTVLSSDLAQEKYEWSNGQKDKSFNLVDSFQTTAYAVTVTSAQGFTASASINNLWVATQHAPPGFSYSVNPPDSISSSNPRLVVQWTGKDGVLWSSKLQSQPSDAYFRVTKIEPYENNENGKRTVKLTIIYDCMLYRNVDGPGKRLTGEGTLAFALE